jgi:microcin C transport system substrate-binding protein
MLMGLKSGDFDFMNIQSSKQWAVDVQGEKYNNGCIEKQLWKHGQTEGMQGFALNQRRAVFQDRNVRKALALAMDFDWMNSTLFYKQYTPTSGFFNNSELAAHGLPTADELKLLDPWKGKVPEEVFTKPLEPVGKGLDLRARLTEAKKLLEDAGWSIKNGALTNAKSEKMEFTILLDDPSWLRIVEPYIKNLKILGIAAHSRVEDQSIYIQKLKRFDYDAIVDVLGQSESPGNEQRDMWHSSSAATEDSRNSMGIKNPAVDALVEAVISAKSRKELVTAVHALDRVLWHNHYIVPHWYMSAFRATYWNRFDLPKTMPLYFSPLSWFMNFASENPAKEAILKDKKCK